MKITSLIWLTALLISVGAKQAHAGFIFSELVVFGDSLSDSGNVFKLTSDSPGHVADPPSPPYFNGRATNGPNWVDRLADRLSIPRPTAYLQDPSGTNYAFAGAATGGGTSTRFPSPTFPPNAPIEVDNVGTQIESFLTNRQSFQQNQLVTLWAGAGDLANVTGPADIVKIVDNLEDHIRTLNDNGATTVVVPTQLDSGLAPFFDLPGTPDPLIISGVVKLLDDLLDSRLMLLAMDPALDINIISVDMFSLTQRLVNDSSFVNTENAWLIDFSQGMADSADPNDYLFFDVIHPTARAHSIIGDAVFSAVVPTPSALFLLIVGILIFEIQRSRQQFTVSSNNSNNEVPGGTTRQLFGASI